MIHFEIVFSYEAKTYLALVQRISGRHVEYHISILKKAGLKYNTPFVVEANILEGSLKYYWLPNHPDLGCVLAKAIENHCYNKMIPLLA